MKRLQSILVFCLGVATISAQSTRWAYECRNNRCDRVELTAKESPNAVSFPVCRIFCSETPGSLWPRVNGLVKLENVMAKLSPTQIQFSFNQTSKNNGFWKANEERLRMQILAKVPKAVKLNDDGSRLMILIDVANENSPLNLETNEHYHVKASENDGTVTIRIQAETIFGARHAVETISQLTVYDNIRGEIQVVANFEIDDRPVFAHRGFLLDTSRNFYSVNAIKRTIDGMALVKMNVFHWHITDSHSFPLSLKLHPDFAEYGAYDVDKVYTAEDIADIYDYGYVRGVRVMPEFDAPAHVGEGWQKKNVTTCFNFQPWSSYCVEPPCGQLDPTNEKVYDILEDIYREMIDLFRKPDVFHMGGDEVNFGCWNSSSEIQNWMLARGWGLNESDFLKLWNYFQENALSRLDKAAQREVPVIVWTSGLTNVPYLQQYLDKNRYIIQIWTKVDDQQIDDLLQNGYRVILSNYDALYLDCGLASWIGDGNNWCSPYIGWQKVYNNSFARFGKKYRPQFLGAEAALWSEEVDEHTMDARVWPRLSALAERLWLDPQTNWREAEARMLMHRERLIENGILAEPLQPRWCLQHEGDCPAFS